MFYTHTITVERLENILNQINNKNKMIDICGQEFSILFDMPLPTRNTRKKQLVLLLREHFNKDRK